MNIRKKVMNIINNKKKLGNNKIIYYMLIKQIQVLMKIKILEKEMIKMIKINKYIKKINKQIKKINKYLLHQIK